MQETTLPLDGLSSVRGKPVIARFDGDMLSSCCWASRRDPSLD